METPSAFCTDQFSVEDASYALYRAVSMWHNEPGIVTFLRQRIMAADFSWENTIEKYIAVYRRVGADVAPLSAAARELPAPVSEKTAAQSPAPAKKPKTTAAEKPAAPAPLAKIATKTAKKVDKPDLPEVQPPAPAKTKTAKTKKK